jgi:hypothetical protein
MRECRARPPRRARLERRGHASARDPRRRQPQELALIEDDEDIAILVLAAATGKEGPGPLVSALIKNAGEFPIPVAIVPGNLSDEDLDTMT